MTDNELLDTIEHYIDGHAEHGEGVPNVMYVLARACWQKAARLQDEYADYASAKAWESRAAKIDGFAAALDRKQSIKHRRAIQDGVDARISEGLRNAKYSIT